MNADGYNERAWAIDLISAANQFLSKLPGSPISEFGGERSLPGQGGPHMFPDVLVFGDVQFGAILQGWELKFPDTPITDPEFIANAIEKATRLKTDSFLLWNVTTAVLYVRSEAGEGFAPFKRWEGLPDVRRRSDVLPARNRWQELLRTIILDLVELFDSGVIRPASLLDSLVGDGLVAFVVQLAPLVETTLRARAITDGAFDSETTNWWYWASSAYPEAKGNRWNALSRLVLTSWMSKLVFAHVLKRYYSCARTVETIDQSTTIAEAVELLAKITQGCDFRNVFIPQLGEEHLPASVWSAIQQLNGFLSELSLEAIDPTFAQGVVQSVVSQTRNAAGQFSTPYYLGELLSRLTIRDKTSHVLDPCCGSGTIARAAYDLKVRYGVGKSDALATTWLSDKFSFPLQMAAMVMIDAENVDQVVQVFRDDIADLAIGRNIALVSPVDGSDVLRVLPPMAAVVSNLPFVQQEDLRHLNAGIEAINATVERMTAGEASLAGRSDLFAYLPFYIWRLLEPGGRAGLIVSNAWLGTEWGRSFREALLRFFSIDLVVVSGSGRWFDAADVVTTVVVLTRKELRGSTLPPAAPDELLRFASLSVPLRDIRDQIDTLAAALGSLGGTHAAAVMEDYSLQDIRSLEEMGVEWNALFGGIKWLADLKPHLVPVSDFFEINRGTRRGWNAMFYPAPGHGIERKYIRPVLRTIASVDGLVADVDAEAFCCMEGPEVLVETGATGAKDWIDRFAAGVNGTGVPLPVALAQANLHWYSMPDTTLADIVAAVNYDRRLFLPRMRSRAFVDQRLTRFTRRDDSVDTDLLHALLNSTLGLLYLEMLGFGRGLGALDLSPTRMKAGLRVLDPAAVGPDQRRSILAAFEPLLSRDVLPILEELDSPDRIAFDEVVFGAYGLEAYLPLVRQSLRRLFSIRYAVKE
jgi:SAM-dependent methyltransferase